MPQTNKPSAGSVEIPIPLAPMATDQPENIPPSATVIKEKAAATSVSSNEDDLFPLLSKSPGFKEAMTKADASGETNEATTLPPAMVMMRNLRILEGSELYKGATPRNRVLMQQAFYKKYVVPAQKAANHKGSFDEWIKDRGTYWQYKVNPASQDRPSILGITVPGGSKKEMKAGLESTIDAALKFASGSLAEDRKSQALKGQTPEAREGTTAFAGGIARTNLEVAKTIDDARRTAIFHFKNISRELSFGDAMLNAQLTPHMGPIIMDPHYREVRKDGVTQEIRQFLKDDDYFALNGYQQNTTNKIMRTTGGLVGDLPWFFATDGVAALGPEVFGGVETAAQAKKVLSLTAVQNIGARAVGNAAQGYVMGTLEGNKDPVKTAEWFGGTSFVVGLAGHGLMRGLISPAAKFLGTIFGWGGGKLTNELVTQAATNVANKAPQAVVSPVSTALAGSPKQKISAAVISALNQLTNGEFIKAPDAAKRAALAKLAAVSPEFAEQIAYLDKTVIASEAAQNLIPQRDAVPEFNNFMTKLEQASKEPTHISIANAASDNSEAQLMRRSSDKWVQEIFKDPIIRRSIQEDLAKYTGPERRAAGVRPGAASAKSLEFGENLTVHVDSRLEQLGLGKNVLQFETRADKLLFYLNVAQAELMQKGTSPQVEKEFQLLLSKLSEEFPGEKGALPSLLKMSDKLWSDMEQATQAGLFREGETFRYWRQHSRPGESPFAHEVELLQQAQRAEARRTEELKMELAGDERNRRQGESPEDWVKRTSHLFPDTPPKAYAILDNKTFKDYIAQYQKGGPARLDQLVKDLKEKGFKHIETKRDRYTSGKTATAKFEHPDGHKISVGVNQDMTINGGTFSAGEAKTKELVKPTETAITKTEAKAPQTDDEKLKAAFAKSGDKGTGTIDTQILRTVTEKLFPGQHYEKLTPVEQSEINQIAAAISKGMKKGK